jgi:hypothetical protein
MAFLHPVSAGSASDEQVMDHRSGHVASTKTIGLMGCHWNETVDFQQLKPAPANKAGPSITSIWFFAMDEPLPVWTLSIRHGKCSPVKGPRGDVCKTCAPRIAQSEKHDRSHGDYCNYNSRSTQLSRVVSILQI